MSTIPGIESAEVMLVADEPAKRSYSVSLAGERLKAAEEKWVNLAKEKAKIPGFRKGQIPHGILIQQLGDWIRQKVTTEVFSSVAQEITRKNSMKLVAMPVVSGLDYVFGEKLNFSLIFELEPTLEIKDYKGLPVTKHIRQVKESDVEEELKHLLRGGQPYYLVPAQEGAGAQEEFWALLDMKVCDPDDQKTPLWELNHELVNLGTEALPWGLREAIAGKKSGDEFQWMADLDDDCPHDGWSGKKMRCEARLLELKRLKEPEGVAIVSLGWDEGKLSEVKGAIRRAFEQRLALRERALMKDQIAAELLDRQVFEAPKAEAQRRAQELLHRARYLLGLQGQGLTAQHEQELKVKYQIEAENEVRLDYIVREIARRENIKVQEEDFKKRLEAAQNEQEKKQIINNKEDVYFDILAEKVYDFLIASAQIQEENIASAP